MGEREYAERHAERRRRRQLALAMLAVLLVIVAAFAVHWVQRMQYREISSDAVVEGKLVTVLAPVTGRVLAIAADHGDSVRAGQSLVELTGPVSQAMAAAPQAGVVTQRLVQAGQQVAAGARLMVLAPLADMWVAARFEQSQLRRLASGQLVTLTAATYGRKIRFHGMVIHMGHQAAEPVRISLDASEVAAHPLLPGLPMRVSVDTRS